MTIDSKILTCGQASHGDTKPLADGGEGGGVGAIRSHVSKAVQQSVPGYAHMLKPDLTIVNAVEAHLGAVVADAHAFVQLALVIPEAHDEYMRPLPLAIDGQLGKDCADLAVLG